MGYSPRGHQESDTTLYFYHAHTGFQFLCSPTLDVLYLNLSTRFRVGISLGLRNCISLKTLTLSSILYSYSSLYIFLEEKYIEILCTFKTSFLYELFSFNFFVCLF